MFKLECWQECPDQIVNLSKQTAWMRLVGQVIARHPESFGFGGLLQLNIKGEQVDDYYEAIRMATVLGGGFEGITFAAAFEEINELGLGEVTYHGHLVTKLLYGQIEESFMFMIGSKNYDKLSEHGQERLDMLANGEYPRHTLLVGDRVARQHNLALQYPGLVAPIQSIIRIRGALVGYQMPYYTGTWLSYDGLTAAEKQKLAPVAKYIDKIGGSNIVLTASGEPVLVDVTVPFC